MNATPVTLTPQIARDRVASGAALLDMRLPGWSESINIETLNLQHSCLCVLGQLYGNFWRIAAAWFGEPDPGGTESARFGFTVASDSRPWDERRHDWRILNNAWIEAITDRRVPQVPIKKDLPMALIGWAQ